MKKLLALATASVAAVGVLASPAQAAGQLYAAAFTYVSPATPIVQGDSLNFTNLDIAPHNVVSHAAGPVGGKLFRAAQIGTGGTVPVVGVEAVPAGAYPFLCTLHPWMQGVLVVQ